MENYGDYTYNARNPLKRFSHRKRFQKSIASIPTNNVIRLLDFGCGDALFLNRLKTVLNEKCFLMGFDPIMQPIESNSVNITASWEEVVKEAPFDYITCFEVLEHFDENLQIETLDKLSKLLSDTGYLVLSVPIENGLPSLVKNFIRKFSCSKKDLPLYSINNIMAACLKKKLLQYRTGSNYLSHLGFYHTDLEKVLFNDFTIVEKSFSPFSWLGAQFNAQVFYRIRKKS